MEIQELMPNLVNCRMYDTSSYQKENFSTCVEYLNIIEFLLQTLQFIKANGSPRWYPKAKSAFLHVDTLRHIESDAPIPRRLRQ